MNYIDIILGVLLLWGLIHGLRKGLFVSIASMVALIAGIYIAVHFSHVIGDFLGEYVDWGEGTMRLVAFAITFIIVIIIVSLAGKLLTKIADFASLGILNKILGATFGVLKFAFIASVIIMLLDAGNRTLNIIKQETLDTSILYPPVKKLAPAVLPSLLNNSKKKDSEDAT
ncbi:CvpA family protein [Aquimarina sp. RZ0]|uniref:CvpA family protein n=1 Tax=Aquimarina sp. RZ0 TaxID=2607730 RepID=UPI0011F0A924|nr:CvpA family protein [Aquimarina sp. RZ0]KAA1247616.1 CvpA family protein [Aquimarina sp. RZ0]